MGEVEDKRILAMRRLAVFEASSAEQTKGKLIDDHSAAFRWMIASLFALNGGAILAIFGKGDIIDQPNFASFWIFFGGVVNTFLAAFFGQLSDRAMIAEMHRWGLYWTNVGSIDERDEVNEAAIKQSINRAERSGRVGRIHTIFAMIFFVFGVLTAVVLEQEAELVKLEHAMDRREADLQRLSDAVDKLEVELEKVADQQAAGSND